jgi:Protein of unknown function (DUF4244)
MSLLPVFLLVPALLAGRALLAYRFGGRPDASAVQPVARHRDDGMSTAEYAVGTVAAVAFAGVLYAVVSSSATHDMISSVVRRALTLPF